MRPQFWPDLFTGTIESEYFATEEEYLDYEYHAWLAHVRRVEHDSLDRLHRGANEDEASSG